MVTDPTHSLANVNQIFSKFSFGYDTCTMVSGDAEEPAAGTQPLTRDEDKNVFTMVHNIPKQWECWVGVGGSPRRYFLLRPLPRVGRKKKCVCPSQFTGAS